VTDPPPPVKNVAGNWLGTVTNPAGSIAEIWEYRLSLSQTGSRVSGTSRARVLSEPRYFVDYRVTGTVTADGRLTLNEGQLLTELRPPGSLWCPLSLTLMYDSTNGPRLSGNAAATTCLAGVVRLQPEGVGATTWPTAPTATSPGFDAACGDWPNHTAGCFWLMTNGWRDAQPMRRHFNPAFNGYHLGADWNLGSGSDDANMPVYAIADGTVSEVRPDVANWGNVLFVRHDLPIGTFTSMYAHVNWNVSGQPNVGDIVARGQQIARVGDAGGTRPYHLHVEVRSGTRTDVGPGYVPSQSGRTPQGQIDPNIFIRTYR
jgi:murein DD-endopeptidase MepM/ murein hydrolase activator NlpD